MTRLQLAEQFSEATRLFADNMAAGNWGVAGYWAYIAFERLEQLQCM